MKKYKVYIIIGILLAIVFLAVPFIFDNFILGYNFNSRTTGDAWVGFWGGYLGSLIGAFATIMAIRLQINDNKEQLKIEEEKRLRPFLQIIVDKENQRWVNGENLIVRNVGLHAACNIKFCIICGHSEEFIPIGIDTICVNECIEWSLDLSGIKKWDSYLFYFQDIIGNDYEQEIRFIYKTPKLNFNTNPYEPRPDLESMEVVEVDYCISEFPKKCM